MDVLSYKASVRAPNENNMQAAEADDAERLSLLVPSTTVTFSFCEYVGYMPQTFKTLGIYSEVYVRALC